MMMIDGGGQTLLNQNAITCRAQLGGPIRLAPTNQQQEQRQQQQHHQQTNTMRMQQQQYSPASCSPIQTIPQQDQRPVQYISNQSNFHQPSQQNRQHHHNHHHHHHQQQQHIQQLQNHNHHQQQQQQQQQQQCHQAPVNAPPTPPGDLDSMYYAQQSGQTIYLEPSDTRQQTGAWVMHTIQQQQHHHHQSDEQQMQQQQFHTSQGQTISSYYYDIDDGFSDIMSAPSTPEPPMMLSSEVARQHHNRPNYQQQQQQQQRVDELDLHTNYTNYLPYNQPALASQQPQQQHAIYNSAEQLQTPPHAYTAAMSPDSSSLSTTSSSPSDHSLYQGSPPAMSARNQQQQQQILSAGPMQMNGQQQQQATIQLQQQRGQHAFQMHALPLSPVEPQQVGLAQRAIKMEPIMQQQQQQTAKLAVPIAAQVQPQQAQQVQQRSSPIHLWEFLKELLGQVDSGCADASIIRWLDRQKGVFKIEDSVRVAKLWGKRKNKPKMNYDKLSRSIRQYYKKGIMKKTDRSQRLVYQFCSAYSH